MKFIRHLDTGDVASIAASIKRRQEKFTEDFFISVGVVLMNYGDKFVKVECIRGEWEGQKKDLELRDDVPLCPNGHPLFETTRAPFISLVED